MSPNEGQACKFLRITVPVRNFVQLCPCGLALVFTVNLLFTVESQIWEYLFFDSYFPVNLLFTVESLRVSFLWLVFPVNLLFTVESLRVYFLRLIFASAHSVHSEIFDGHAVNCTSMHPRIVRLLLQQYKLTLVGSWCIAQAFWSKSDIKNSAG